MWKRPLLWDKFDRMLFLTANAVPAGHQELIRVLRSFRCSQVDRPSGPRPNPGGLFGCDG